MVFAWDGSGVVFWLGIVWWAAWRYNEYMGIGRILGSGVGVIIAGNTYTMTSFVVHHYRLRGIESWN